MEKVIKLSMDDVICSYNSGGLMPTETFKATEALSKLCNKCGIHPSWVKEGISCQSVGQNTDGWRKGKFRICFEFIPDETELPLPPQSALDTLPPQSALDTLRQQIKDLEQ